MIRKMFTLEEMITPVVLKVVYYIGLAIVFILGIMMLVGGVTTPYRYGGGSMVLAGMLTLLAGPILLRVYVELVMVMFRILARLEDISGKLNGLTSVESGSPEKE